MRVKLLILLALVATTVAGQDMFSGNNTSPIVRHYMMANSGVVNPNTPGTATACWNFEAAVAGTYADDCTGSVTMTVNGSPTKVDDGTWPAGLSGSQGNAWTFDGDTDYLSRADDGTFDPAGDFSVQCVFTPYDVTSNGYIISKWDLSDDRGWVLLAQTTSVYFGISDNGYSTAPDMSTCIKTSALANYRPTFVTAAYDYVSDGSSTMKVYVDNLSTQTTSSANGPVHNSSANLEIGSRHTGQTKLNGTISDCKFYDGIVITEAQHDYMRNQWLGLLSNSTNPITVTSAAPPAVIVAAPGSGTQPFIVDQPANLTTIGSPASGSGGIYGAGAISNLAQRASLETSAGAGGGCTDRPTGWVWGSCAAGDGTADLDQLTPAAHGGVAYRATLTGTTSAAQIFSTECYTTHVGEDHAFEMAHRCSSGTCTAGLYIIEYDAADCTTALATNTVINIGAGSSDWAWYHGSLAAATWHVDTSSYRIRAQEAGDGGVTSDFDAIQARAGTLIPTGAFCGADTDATAVCNFNDITDDAPPQHMVGTWEFEATVRSPIDGAVAAPNRYILRVPATAGNNNKIQFYLRSDNLFCEIFDSAGVEKESSVAAAYNADTDYVVRMSKSAAGVVQCCFNGTCDATPATGAITDGVGSEIVFGSTGGIGGDVWIQDPIIYRRLTP